MNPQVTITKRGPGMTNLDAALADIERSDVLVGIPQARNSRDGEPIGNAALMFILTHGSPLHGIPATPVIEPAIAADGNRQIISGELKDGAKALLDRNATQATASLRRAGTAGSNAAKAWFTDPRNNWPPNKPSTIRRKGSDRRNIDTGALRRAITFVLRQEP